MRFDWGRCALRALTKSNTLQPKSISSAEVMTNFRKLALQVLLAQRGHVIVHDLAWPAVSKEVHDHLLFAFHRREELLFVGQKVILPVPLLQPLLLLLFLALQFLQTYAVGSMTWALPAYRLQRQWSCRQALGGSSMMVRLLTPGASCLRIAARPESTAVGLPQVVNMELSSAPLLQSLRVDGGYAPGASAFEAAPHRRLPCSPWRGSDCRAGPPSVAQLEEQHAPPPDSSPDPWLLSSPVLFLKRIRRDSLLHGSGWRAVAAPAQVDEVSSKSPPRIAATSASQARKIGARINPFSCACSTQVCLSELK